MVSQQVDVINWEESDEYLYDNIKIEIPISDFEEIQENLVINGIKFREYLLMRPKRIEIHPNKILLNFKNCFGEVKISYKGVERKAKIAPSKIFRNLNPREAYFFVKNKILSDIGSFLSFLVKDSYDLKTLEYFKIVAEDFVRSTDFLVIFLERLVFSLNFTLQKVFSSGPIHKETLVREGAFGSRISLSPKNALEPYKNYFRQTHTIDTLLNRMLFQTLYFIILACNYLRFVIRITGEDVKKKEILNKLEKIYKLTNFLLDKYQLWCFFDDKLLNISELSNKIANQSNIYYREVFEIYKEILKIVFSKTILNKIEEKIEFPIISFEYIYELWAISLLYNSLSRIYKTRKVSFEAYEKRKVKMKIEFFGSHSKKAILIYEIKFNPSLDSLYFEKLVSNTGYFKIKPDILIILEQRNKKKIILGDVKFSKDSKLELPKLKDVYKVLGYLIDLSGKSRIIRGNDLEGILIFPGFIDQVRVPQIRRVGRSNKIIYINIMPLNFERNQLNLF